MSRDSDFQRIKQYFDRKDRELNMKGKLPLGSTEKGFWGVTHLDDFYAWCTLVELEKFSKFIDLGSGDGRAVLVAALFTAAAGVEFDERLHEQALQAAKELVLAASFIKGDYTQLDLSEYDVWFCYADHNFNWLEPKQLELQHLYLYHDTFHPHFLHKEKIIWIGQIPVFHYTQKSTSE